MLRNRIILDEDEAEIVEFYEKESSLMQTIPFLRDEVEEEEGDGVGSSKPTGVVEEVMEEKENTVAVVMPHQHQHHLLLDSPTRNHNPPAHHHHRTTTSASDSSLMRHLPPHSHHRRSESRQSQGDLYYSMVLQTLIHDDNDEGHIILGNEDEILHLSEVQDDNEDKREEEEEEYCAGPLGIMENVSSLTEDEGCNHGSVGKGVDTNIDDDDDNVNDDELASFKSAQSEEEEEEEEEEGASQEQEPQGPPSSHSSMSSLTSDGYDIEAACSSRRVHEDAISRTKHTIDAMCHTRHSSTLYAPTTSTDVRPRLMQVSKRLALAAATDSDMDTTPTANAPTPPRSNLHRDRRQYDLHTTNTTSNTEEETKPQQLLSRRVSFCNEVKVRRIPWTQSARQQCHELTSSSSFESYLYFMLFTVAIVIGIFSLMPANPSLSPIHSMDRVDIFQRADTILSSQWDVEL